MYCKTSGFQTALSVTIFSAYTRRLNSDLVYYSKDGSVYTVPAGFVTDYASVPRLFWVIVPPYGKYTESAVLHDRLCKLKGFSRKRADQLFDEAMGEQGVAWWRRKLMYGAVRLHAIITKKD